MCLHGRISGPFARDLLSHEDEELLQKCHLRSTRNRTYSVYREMYVFTKSVHADCVIKTKQRELTCLPQQRAMWRRESLVSRVATVNGKKAKRSWQETLNFINSVLFSRRLLAVWRTGHFREWISWWSRQAGRQSVRCIRVLMWLGLCLSFAHAEMDDLFRASTQFPFR